MSRSSEHLCQETQRYSRSKEKNRCVDVSTTQFWQSCCVRSFHHSESIRMSWFVLIDTDCFTSVVFRRTATSMYSHRCSRSSSITEKSVSKLLQRRDTHASHMHDSFSTFFERTCVYSNLLFSLLPSSTTLNLIAFFFFCVRLVVIDENHRRDIINRSDNNINFDDKNSRLIVKHAIVNSQVLLQTVFESVRIIMIVPISILQEEMKTFNEVHSFLRSFEEFSSQCIENVNTLRNWHAT